MRPDHVQVDGTRAGVVVGASAEAIIDGDCKVAVIKAASILAKVYRDGEMRRLHALYPEYGFAEHKGYATAAHPAALARLGPSPVHRCDLRPVRDSLQWGALARRSAPHRRDHRGCAMSTPAFVHLNVHSEYSLVDGVVRIPALVEAVAAAGMPAVALADQDNLFAMVKFYSAAQKRGVKPIVGADVRVRDPDDPARDTRLILLCQDRTGYRNLSRLLTRAQVEGRRGGTAPRLERAWLSGATDGLIALSGARDATSDASSSPSVRAARVRRSMRGSSLRRSLLSRAAAYRAAG